MDILPLVATIDALEISHENHLQQYRPSHTKTMKFVDRHHDQNQVLGFWQQQERRILILMMIGIATMKRN
jgi:hypothetical protein